MSVHEIKQLQRRPLYPPLRPYDEREYINGVPQVHSSIPRVVRRPIIQPEYKTPQK